MRLFPTRKNTMPAVVLACLLLTGCAQGGGMTFDEFMGKFKGRNDAAAPQAAVVPSPASVSSAPVALLPPVQCRAKGAARFARGWFDFKETSFVLNDAQGADVTLTRASGNDKMKFRGIYDGAGQKMVFCPVVQGPPGTRVDCASLYVLEDDLTAGIRRTFDVPDGIRGGVITCAYDGKNLRKL